MLLAENGSKDVIGPDMGGKGTGKRDCARWPALRDEGA